MILSASGAPMLASANKLPIDYMWTANSQQASPRKLYFQDHIKAGSSWENRIPLTPENIKYYLNYCVQTDQIKSAIRILDFEIWLDGERRKAKEKEKLRDDLWHWIIESNLMFQWAFCASKYGIENESNLYFPPRDRVMFFIESLLGYIMLDEVSNESNRIQACLQQVKTLSKISKKYLGPIVEGIEDSGIQRNGILLMVMCALHDKEAEIESEILMKLLNDPIFMFHDSSNRNYFNLGRAMMKLGDNKKVVLDLLFGNLIYFHHAYIEAIKKNAINSGWNLQQKETKISPVIKITAESLFTWAEDTYKKWQTDQIILNLKNPSEGFSKIKNISRQVLNICETIDKNYLIAEFNQT